MTTSLTMIMRTPKRIGVILAGGRSTRMGKDKAYLELEGVSFIERARTVLEEISCEHIVLSGHNRLDWKGLNIPDLSSGLGPVSGICRLLNWANTEFAGHARLIFIPVDTPLLSAELLLQVARDADNHDGSCVVRSPLPLVLNLNAHTLQQSKFAELDLSLGNAWSIRRFIQPLCIKEISPGSINTMDLTNINWPAELELLRSEITSSA